LFLLREQSGSNLREFVLYSYMQALGMSPSLLAAGMAADNLAMAVYFGVIMSIPADGKELSTEDSTGT
jgi:hypothetical protein